MTDYEIVKMVEILPGIRNIAGMTTDEKKNSITSFLSTAIEEVILSHDWDFACDVADYPGGSVTDQSDYILKGNKNDCRDIINVRYGDNLILLDRMSQVDVDEWLNYRTHTTVNIWVPAGREAGFPKITLVDAPSSDDETIRYRYRRNKVNVSEFPDEFGFVLVTAIAKRILPEYMPIYERDLRLMMDRYKDSGGEDNPAKLDPLMVMRNNRRAGKLGYR